MSTEQFVQNGAKASLVVVFFAFPTSVALANMALLSTLLFWLLGFCVWSSTRRLTSQAMSNPVASAAVALFAWIAIATMWSPAEGSTVFGALQKYMKLLLIPVFIGLLQDPTTRRRCWQAFAAAMLLTLLVTWLNVWFDFEWTRTHNQGFGKDHTVFKDRIAQGMLMSFFTVLTAYYARQTPIRTMSLLAWIVAALAASSVLFLSAGRTGYLSLPIALLAFVMFSVGLQARKLALATTVVVAVIAIAFTTSTVLKSRTALAWEEITTSSLTGPVTSAGSRVEMIRFSIDSALENPVLGHGTGSYAVLAKQHFTDAEWCSVVCVHPHNQFLFFLFEHGLIGLLLFFWFIVAIGRQALREDASRRALAMAFLSILVVSNMTHSSFWLSTENHFFSLMTALLMAAAHPRPQP